jgi:LmbE family N-acetylglucosaminyl deacetylase
MKERKMRKQKWICVLIFLILLCSLSAGYEGWIDAGEIALKQALADLTSDMTLMCLAAHPDDEDGATLTYYRRKHGVRTAILYATRGEGGQNQIGSELYEELGVIRAYENQAAARVYGAEVYDLNKRDFGYSKSAEETFRFWGHEDSLQQLVRIIREVRPDVIITNHDTERGHGHHQAFGIIALEAFDAAADASKFPQQIENGLSAWQVKRLFVRARQEEADVTINVGEYNQPRGYSYAQIASEGFKMHRSQGMGGTARRGPVYRYYKLVRSSKPAPEKLEGLLDGLADDTDAPRVLLPKFLEDAVQGIPMPRDELVRKLIEYIQALRILDVDNTMLDAQKRELESAIAKALDLYLTVETDDNVVTRGQTFTVRASLTNCGRQVIEDVEFRLLTPQGWTVESAGSSFKQLKYNETATGVFNVTVAENAPFTLPYAQRLYDDSFMKPLIKGVVLYKAHDTILSITSDATFDVSADLEVQILPETSIVSVSPEDQISRYVVEITNRSSGELKGYVEMFSEAGWYVTDVKTDFAVAEDRHAFAAFDLTIPSNTAPGDSLLEARAFYESTEGESNTVVAKGTVKAVDVKVAGDLYVGYVKSYDDTIEWALKQLNVKSRSLESDDLRFGDLSVYDTIILDIRAYLVRDDLVESNQRLLDYVSDGGNLVVMYHKTYEWNGRQYAPYKLVLSRDRVTVEEAPIAILAPEHPLFTFPNRITESDWDGWIQERGLYFPSEWAQEYKELLSCSDPGEEPLRGGYLVAEYGKGTYIYTSYVWYRQLQILNPGAFRNFANMISLPKYSQRIGG